MSKKDRHRHRKQLRKWEKRSDARTAAFLARRLDEIRSDLADLIPDLQTFEHYLEITQLVWCVRTLAELHKKYQKKADGFSWEDD